MRTLRITIAYDGTAYAGWQFQPDQPTVQQTLEAAIHKVTGEQIRVLASGRTDAGVHALGQVVGFRTECPLPLDVLRRALNANLPDDIAVLEAREAPDDFHAISHVVRKRYRYVIHDGPVRDVFNRRYVWHYIYGRLDADAMQRAALPLLGTHDFRSFETSGAPRETSIRTIFDLTVRRGRAGNGLPSPNGRGAGGEDLVADEAVGCVKRTVNSEAHSASVGALHAPYESDRGRAGDRSPPCAEHDDSITIEVEADGFLYNMVRAIVGTLAEVGRGRRPERWPGEVVAAMNRRAAGPTAPPQGLFLVRVQY